MRSWACEIHCPVAAFSRSTSHSHTLTHASLSQLSQMATMMWYLPVTDKTVWDYGTCLHSTSQWKSRAIKAGGKHRGSDGVDGEGDCYYKFRFLPNTGYR